MRFFLLGKNYDKGSVYKLTKKEKNYINNVLRIPVGSSFTSKDEEGIFYLTTLIDEETLSCAITEEPEEALLDNLSPFKGPFANLTVYQGICKGKKNEEIVRSLTEAGVRKIIFVTTNYTQEKGFSDKDRERLEAIKKEAVQQSGALFTPVIYGPVPLKLAIDENKNPLIFFHQSQREKTKSLKEALEQFSLEDPISLLIGSEGGFSDEECAYLENKSAIPALLLTNILRAEHAALYATGAIQTILHEA